MICLFCDCYHKSEKCDIYKTDESKKGAPNSNRFCFTCRVESLFAHLPEDKNCKCNNNCVGWHSTEHHKLFCAERIKAFSLFLPKIDQNLLPRFLETVEIDEKYSIILNSATTNFPLKRIKIKDTFKKGSKLSGFNIIVGKMNLENLNVKRNQKLYNSIKSKIIFCLPRNLKIDNAKLTSEMVLQLLSPYTKNFEMHDCVCNPNLAFVDILKKAPNLQELNIADDTNVKYNKTWIEDLLNYKSGNNLILLNIEIDAVELDIENFIKFVQRKCSNKISEVEIKIWFDLKLLDKDINGKAFNVLIKKMEKYFIEDGDSGLTIGYSGVDGYRNYSLQKFKQPQKRIMSTPTATKRKRVKKLF